MKIVILSDGIPPDRSGGAERVAWLSALDLQRAGHDVYIITTTRKPTFSESRQGVMTYHLHAGYSQRWQGWLSLRNPQTIGALRRLLQQIRPDVVHAHNIHLNLSYASLTVAHQLGIPVVWTAHDTMTIVYTKLTHFIDPARRGRPRVIAPDQYRLPRAYNLRQMRLRYNPMRNLVIRQIVTNQVQARLGVSNAQRQALEANGLPPFEVVYNGIDATQYDGVEIDRLSAALRERWQLDGKKVVLFAGRLTVEKGSEQLFAAMQRVVAQLPEAKLLILTNHADDWEQSSYHDTLTDHVQLGGWLHGPELIAAFKVADVVCVPSIFLDCAPMVILEAMAAKKPVVATGFGGASELIVDGESGCIVNPYDTAYLADCLVQVLSNPTVAVAMGIAGRQRVEQQFSLARQTAAFTAIYQQLVEAQRSAK
jgi:glycosyltransferase involved in cell wall biosynthesis